MIGLDTNILVRYLTQDDSPQLRAVMRLLNKTGESFFISHLVMVELHWVLRSQYHWSRAEIAESLAKLISIHNTVFEDEPALKSAISAYARGEDLADWLIRHRAVKRECSGLASFDSDFQSHHPDFVFQPK